MAAAVIGFCELLCSYDEEKWAVVLIGSARAFFVVDVVKRRRREAATPLVEERRLIFSSLDLGEAADDAAGLGLTCTYVGLIILVVAFQTQSSMYYFVGRKL